MRRSVTKLLQLINAYKATQLRDRCRRQNRLLRLFKSPRDGFPFVQRLLIEHWPKLPFKFIDSFRHIGQSNISKQPNIQLYAVCTLGKLLSAISLHDVECNLSEDGVRHNPDEELTIFVL